MSLTLELKKIKRTGFFPAFLAGGIIAGAFPVINTAARPEMFTSMSGSAAEILMSANYETIAMLNLLLLTAGACILYHIEYAGNGIQKMQTLPVSESGLFFGKAFLLVPSFFLMLCIEGAAMFFCGIHWFGESIRASAIAGSTAVGALAADFLRCFGFAFLLTLPAALLLLLFSSLCRNMWVMLGIGILCIFLATMLPDDNFLISLFPFAMPFQTYAGADRDLVIRCIIAAISETLVIGLIEIILIRIRRLFA